MYAIMAQREPRLSYRDVMVEAAMNGTHVPGAGGIQHVGQQAQVEAAAEAEVPDEQAGGGDGGEDDSGSDHTDGSPQLGERQGLCEHHTRCGSHGCRSEVGEGEEVMCAECSEQDEYGRCACDCDQCDESNAMITDGLEAFNLAHGRTATPEEWRMMDGDARAALVDMGMQSAAVAEQQRGMPAEDCREAINHMASENLKEVEVGGKGSCLFLAVKCAMHGCSILGNYF